MRHIGLTTVQESQLTAYQQVVAERDRLAAENFTLRRRIAELERHLKAQMGLGL